MDTDQKIENLLNLALDATSEEREKSPVRSMAAMTELHF